MCEYVTTLRNEKDIYELYESLNWNAYIKRSPEELVQVMKGSYYVVYVYNDNQLIATGRMISDGCLTGLICGVGVNPKYQRQGIGKAIIKHLADYGRERNILLELVCDESLIDYYNKLGFKKFGSAMKYVE